MSYPQVSRIRAHFPPRVSEALRPIDERSLDELFGDSTSTLCICVSLYNEKEEELRNTLDSLKYNTRQLAELIDGNEKYTRLLEKYLVGGKEFKVTIMIVQDGYEKMDDSVRRLLNDYGFPEQKYYFLLKYIRQQ